MIISLLRYIQGFLKIQISGYSPERFLNLCKNKNIAIWGLEPKHNSYEMYIKISAFRKLKPILKKTQTKVSIKERCGLPFIFHKYRKRKLFFIGAILSVLLIYSLTFFIWNIDFEGNQSITDEVLLEYLESIKIKHGMIKNEIDCEEIEKKIRKNFDEVIWVSVSIDGTRLFVQVKENEDAFQESENEEEPCDIIADKTGTITSIVTRDGVPQVKVGDQINEGDLLVSGTIDVLNDAKEVVSHKYVTADADIIIETTQNYENSINKKYEVKSYTDKNRSVRYIKLWNFTLHLGFTKNSFKKYDQSTEETQLKIGEHYYLPVYWGKKEISEYKIITKEYTNEEMEILLTEQFEQYCQDLEENKIHIIEKKFSIIPTSTGIKSIATLKLQEEVGIKRKIVDFY